MIGCVTSVNNFNFIIELCDNFINEFVNLNEWAGSIVDESYDPGISAVATWDQPGNRLSGVPGSLADELEGEDSAPSPRMPSPRPPPPSDPPYTVQAQHAPHRPSEPIPLVQNSVRPPGPASPATSKKFPVAIVITAVLVAGILGGLFAAGVLRV